MALHDQFRPPLHPLRHWESFHSNWATRIADALNDRWLPREYLAEEHTHAGTQLEIDVATFEASHAATVARLADGDAAAPPWTPPPPRVRTALAVPVDFESTYQEACRRRRIPER